MFKNLVASLPSAVCFSLHLNHNNLSRAALVTFLMSANYSKRKNCMSGHQLAVSQSQLFCGRGYFAIVLSVA